jgi:hypothetical protein
MMSRRLVVIGILTWSLLSYGRGRERAQIIMVGEGIVKPSVTTTLACWENSAGLAELSGVGLHLLGAQTPAETKDTKSVDWAGASLQFGRSNVGASIGGLSRLNQENNNNNIVMGGVGFAVDSWGFAMGIDAHQYSSSDSRTINLGLLFGASAPTHFGVVAYGIEGDTQLFGFGIAHDVDAATFVLDVLSSNSRTTITPAVGVNVSFLQLALGYRYVKDAESGILGGIGLLFGNNFSLQLQNERLQKYLLGLTFIF